MARKVVMGNKPRSLGVPRLPSGKINHRKVRRDEPPPRPYYAYAQRLRDIDPAAAQVLLIAATTPERKLNRKLADLGLSKEQLMLAIDAAEDRRLGYPLGVLWARGHLCPPPEGQESKEARAEREEEAELLEKAGRIYVAEHYLVWRWQGSPCQAEPSHLSRSMSEAGLEDLWLRPTEIDEEKFEAERLLLKASLEGARRALLRAAPMGLALKAVERICIDNWDGDVHQAPLKHLRAGLRALKEHYNVRLARSRGDRAASPPADAGEGAVQAPAVRRCPRPRMPANLTSDAAHPRPPVEQIAQSIANLLRQKPRSGLAPPA